MSLPTRVALMHYHLRGGGVTRILEHQQQTLTAAGVESVVLIGESPPPHLPHQNVIVVEGLGYADGVQPDADAVLQQARQVARRALGGEPDLWHIHNHSLGKNSVTPTLCKLLADNGEALLLQMHDFAEDGRPGNYASLKTWLGSALDTTLYPQGGRVQYATINQRDARFLADMGIQDARLHTLPNAISFDTAALDATPPAQLGVGRWLLYPTRAIRRKNIGEAILHAVLCKGEAQIGLTLAPQNPQERTRYNDWVTCTKTHGIPFSFALGDTHDFFALLKRADGLLTTSVAEGFGLAFLEPGLVDTPLAGRALPEITHEFLAAGVDIENLYDRLEIPLDWIGRDTLRDRIATKLQEAMSQYGRVCTDHHIETALHSAAPGATVDFGRLDENLQQQVILRCLQDADACAALAPYRLDTHLQTPAAVRKNREIIESDYSLAQYGTRLLRLYETAIASTAAAAPACDPSILLDRFLDPARFCLLRS